ncbi:MAG TPA: YdgA family protein, partial [Burkholderiaceae bacterium]|nr:YdgA family protein [Burkholderiaceae bacterium]
MNKGIVIGGGVAAVIVAALAGGPAVIGGKVQGEVEGAYGRVFQQLPFIRLVEQRYDKGWMSATHTATVEIGCDVPAGPDGQGGSKPIRFVLTDRIQHGPLPGFAAAGLARVQTEVRLAGQGQAEIDKALGGQPLLTSSTLVSYSGSTTGTFSSPKVGFTAPDGTVLAWEGLSGTFSGSDFTGRSTVFEAKAPSLSVKNAKEGGELTMTGLRLAGNTQRPGDYLFLSIGTSEGGIDSISFKADPALARTAAVPRPGQPVSVSMTALKFKSDATLDRDLAASTVSMSAAVQVNEVKIDKIEFAGGLRRLHAPSYEKGMQAFMKQAYACPKPGVKPDPEAALAPMIDLLKGLLPHNPEYAVDKMAATYKGKEGSISYSISTQGVTDQDLKAPPVMVFMGKGVIKASASLPLAWLEEVAAGIAPAQAQQLPMMLDQLSAQGLIKREGDLLKADFNLSAGQATLNG